MRALLLCLAVLALPLAGCDSDDTPDDDDDGSAVSCQALGLIDGDLGGSATSGSVEANCFNVSTAGGLQIIAFDVPSLSVAPRSSLILTFEDTDLGTYSVGGDDDRSDAQYAPSGSSTFEAESGTITLTEFSGSRVRGTFDFRTVNDIDVTGGTFSIDL